MWKARQRGFTPAERQFDRKFAREFIAELQDMRIALQRYYHTLTVKQSARLAREIAVTAQIAVWNQAKDVAGDGYRTVTRAANDFRKRRDATIRKARTASLKRRKAVAAIAASS